MLRGNHTAKIDDKGRLKIPNAFRALVEEKHGSDVFVTSLTGDSVRIYPMPVWLAIEEKMAKIPSTHPARTKFFDRVNYFGQTAAFDNQGRVKGVQGLRVVDASIFPVVPCANTNFPTLIAAEKIAQAMQ